MSIEEQTALPDGGQNVGSAYSPGTVRTIGNLIGDHRLLGARGALYPDGLTLGTGAGG